MKRKQKLTFLLIAAGLLLIPSGYYITTYNHLVLTHPFDIVASKEKSSNVTGYFNEGDEIYLAFIPPPSPGGWELAAEPAGYDSYYGWISTAHVFAYADRYNDTGSRIFRIEFVLVYDPPRLGYKLALLNFSRVIETNETGVFPRVPLKAIQVNKTVTYFECGTANYTGAYRVEMWVGVTSSNTAIPSTYRLTLAKITTEVTYPYAYLLPVGIIVIALGGFLAVHGIQRYIRTRRRPHREITDIH